MSEDKLLTLAKSLLESGDLGGAEDALAARVQIHPIPVDALLLLAEIRLRLGRSEDTLKLLAPMADTGIARIGSVNTASASG